MAESDGLKDFKFPGGLWIRPNADDSPRKLRVVTTNPVVSTDKFGNTRIAFIAWDYNNDQAGILNTTSGVARQIQAIHQDPDFGANIKNTDIKITTVGSGKETRHTVTALPTSEQLTTSMINELKEINLDEKIQDGQRMSFYNRDAQTDPNDRDIAIAATEPDVVVEDIPDEPINLDDIPF